MDNLEKQATLGAQDTKRKQTKQKKNHNTMWVEHHNAQANTNNLNKT
jgi:hypothetical protein